MANTTIPIEQLTDVLAGLSADQLQDQLDRLESDAATVRTLLRVARTRERRERRLQIPPREEACDGC
jgi:hypothetical protein